MVKKIKKNGIMIYKLCKLDIVMMMIKKNGIGKCQRLKLNID